MTKNQKIFIGVAAGIAVLCLAACGVALLVFRSMGTAITNSQFKTPQEAQSAAESIATIDLPPGYTTNEGMKILGMTLVVYKSSSNVHILLMEMPTGQMTDADIQQMQRVYDQQGGAGGVMHVVDTKNVTIRNKPGKIIISEGTENNEQARQVMVYFQGNHGLASLMISGPVSDWDTDAYDKMIMSIR